MKKIIMLISLISTFTLSWACTDFRLQAQDGTLLITRSMEFAADMKSNLVLIPRGKAFVSVAPNGQQGLKWNNTFGYVYLNAFDTPYAVDGMNEAGLSIEALYLPGITQYQKIPSGQENLSLFYLSFGDWILGNFKTVAEIKPVLKNIFVFGKPLPELQNMIFPLHFVITDNTGSSIIVEFINGEMQVHDNALGVLTNSPNYDWHLVNLRNYVNLTPYSPSPVAANGITFTATGQGAGMVGLPGDISPPSRFIKTAIMLKTVIPAKDTDSVLNLAQHIINNVDIPLGFVREGKDINYYTNELTQWVVFKDLTHKVFYYRTYNDLSLRAVNLSDLDFTQNARSLKMPVTRKQNIIDVTSDYKKQPG